MRWVRTGKDTTEIKKMIDTEELEEEEQIEKEICLQERIFKEEMNTVDMTFLKPTDMDTYRLVIVPGPRPALEEAKKEVRKNIWMNETERFIK